MLLSCVLCRVSCRTRTLGQHYVRLSIACWNMRWIMSGRCRASSASMCRIDSSGISMFSSMMAGVESVWVFGCLPEGVDSSGGA